MSKPKAKKRTVRRAIITAGVLGLVVISVLWFTGGPEQAGVSSGTTFTVKRGDLEINVLEGGSVEALESQEIRSQIEGREGTKILHIVEEGYLVTEDDVRNRKVLVELDSSSLRDEQVSQEISVESAHAEFVEREAAYEIQLNQNLSDITAAQLTAKFALLDFEKFLGKTTVQEILQTLGLDEREKEIQAYIDAQGSRRPDVDLPQEMPQIDKAPPVEQTQTQAIPLDDEMIEAIASAMGENGMAVQPDRLKQMMQRGGSTVSPRMAERMGQMGIDIYALARRLGKIPEAEPQPESASEQTVAAVATSFQADPEYIKARRAMNFSVYADEARLEDGEAKQRLRELSDAVLVSQEDYRLAKNRYEGQQRLAEKEFITQNDLELEKLKVDKAEIAVESAETAERLYINYEFPKQAEQLLSDYEEALMSLERTVKEAEAKLSQAEARLKSAERKYKIEAEQLAEVEEQLAATVIYAERPGMVVYGSSTGDRGYRGNDEPIQEGTTVRERQLIITIPDMTRMGARVNVHESAVKQVNPGQKATVRVDANPDEPLSGEVVKVAVLPDSQNRWMNPDLKVYPTMIRIGGVVDWLRPGMSAEVTIHVDTLEDVLYVPIQAVTARGRDRIVHVVTPNGLEQRVVQTGDFSNEFIEIRNGLEEGEVVQLLVPQVPTGATENQEQDVPEPGEAAVT